MKNIVVIYHAECMDGFSAAWVAHQKFGPEAEYLPILHNDPVPKALKNKEVYFLDIVYPMNDLVKVIKANKKVVVLDHHITREKEAKLAGGLYALENSGTVLAWNYFFPGKPLPFFLKLVEEQDLWKYKTKGAKEILASAKLVEYTFEKWSALINELETEKGRSLHMKQGAALLAYQQMMIQEIGDRGNLAKFEGMATYVVNSMNFKSEVGNYLATKKLPPIGIVWAVYPDRISVSLRSNGTVDVSKICEKYGGGGHKAAAGFVLPLNAELPWKYIQK